MWKGIEGFKAGHRGIKFWPAQQGPAEIPSMDKVVVHKLIQPLIFFFLHAITAGCYCRLQ